MRRWINQQVTMPRWRAIAYGVVFWVSGIALLLDWAADLLYYLVR